MKRLALFSVVLLSACQPPPEPPDGDELNETPQEELAHAVYCLSVTLNVSTLREGRLADDVKQLNLDRITPEIARRWFGAAQQAARRANLGSDAVSEMVRQNSPLVRTREELADMADEAFACAAEVDVPDPGAR